MNTSNFLATNSSEARHLVLESIAKHYGISEQEVFEEVTSSEAEHLLDYLTEPARSATLALMQKHGLGLSVLN